MTITEPVSGSSISSAGFGVPEARLLNGLFQSARPAMSGGIVTCGAAFQDLAGTPVTVTVVGANAFALVTAVFDVNPTVTTGNNVFVGILNVDGVGQTSEAHCDDRTSRVTCTQTYKVPLAAGSHTLKLQVKAATGTFLVNPTHTTMSVLVVDLP